MGGFQGRKAGLLGMSALALAVGAIASPAVAQDTASDDEIVVTAQRRSEDLQDVPFAVSVMSGADAAASGAQGFETLRARIPGLQVFGIDQTVMQFSIRGVITDRNARTPQTAALYLDDIPVGLGTGNPNFQQFDIERVEVLRGPQGTLYGAGAQSGALRIITQRPQLDGFDWNGGAEGSVTDHGGENGMLYGVLNLPVSSEFGVRLLGYAREQSGYIENTALGVDEINQTSIQGLRFSALVEPTEALSILGVVYYQTLEADDLDYANRDAPQYTITSTMRQPSSTENAVGSLSVDYDLGFATLTSVTSYQDTDARRQLDATRYAVILGAAPGTFPRAYFPTQFFQHGWTQEVRLTSPDTGRLLWVAGAFFSDLDSGFHQTMPTPGFAAAVPAAPPASSFGLEPDNLYQGIWRFGTQQTALFVDGTYHVTDRLDVSAGVRWYDYEQDGLIDYNGLLQGRHDVLTADAQADGFNPRVNVSYQISDNAMVYGQIARGFRVGGLNEPVPATICNADLAAIGVTTPPLTYDPDSLWSHEIGLKSTWADNRFLFNVAVFDIDWSDIQVSKRLGCGYAVILNGGEMESQGVEIETSLEFFEGLTLAVNAAYTDSQIVETSSAIGLGTSVGQKAPYQPEWAYNVSLEYRHPIFSSSEIFASVEYSYTGERLTDFNPATALRMPEFETVNLRLGLDAGDWSGFIFADNITEEYGIMDVTRRGGSFPVFFSTTPIRPRTIGVRLVKEF